jgi:prophage antirepressor-like protein
MIGKSLFIQYSTFSDETITIKTIEDRGEVLFSLLDVVAALAKENSTRFSSESKQHGLMKVAASLKDHTLDKDEWRGIESTNRNQNDPRYEIFVTEQGLYRIVLQDKSPACKRFQRWIIHDVLTSIQKHGSYPPPVASEIEKAEKHSNLFSLVDQFEKIAQSIKNEVLKLEEKVSQHEGRIQELEQSGPYASYQTIFKRCEDRGILEADYSLIRGYCEKICIEGSIKMGPCLGLGDSKSYPIKVIDASIELAATSKNTREKTY